MENAKVRAGERPPADDQTLREGWARIVQSWDSGREKPKERAGEPQVIAQDYDDDVEPPPSMPPGIKESGGRFHSRTEDPPDGDVNQVEQRLTWLWDGANALEDTAYVEYDWWWETGWSLNSYSMNHGEYENYVWMSSFVRYKNTWFCNPFADTTVEYWPQTIYGFANGYLSGEVWRTKSGDCASLLSFPNVNLSRLYDQMW